MSDSWALQILSEPKTWHLGDDDDSTRHVIVRGCQSNISVWSLFLWKLLAECNQCLGYVTLCSSAHQPNLAKHSDFGLIYSSSGNFGNFGNLVVEMHTALF